MTSPHSSLLDTISTLPLRPGVYRFLNVDGQVLYVGKAKSLKKRVSSYFRGNSDNASSSINTRTQAMLKKACQLEVTVTTTENEALILEANLIKRYQPTYNVLLKDDKSHPYLYLSSNDPYPRLTLLRGERKGKGRFFGPYPSVHAVRETLKWLQRIFPIRQCEDTQFNQRKRPCLQYQIKRCAAPCCLRISQEDYAALVNTVILFLEGKNTDLMDTLKKSMWTAAENRSFEQAAVLRDRIKAIQLIQDQRRINLSKVCDLDIFGVAKDATGFAVQLFFVRNGINLGNCNFFPENSDGLESEEMLESFLAQYYAGQAGKQSPDDAHSLSSLPTEILVNLDIKQHEWLENALSDLRGGKVSLHKPLRGEKVQLLNMAVFNAEQALARRKQSLSTVKKQMQQLAELLSIKSLKRIEAYDISHFQDDKPVGSLIVFGLEGWQKKSYRRFSIKDPNHNDDTSRMAEILSRRFSNTENQPLPDLVLLDGGRGQLNAVLKVLSKLKLDSICFCAIAKGANRNAGKERLFLPNSPDPIILPSDSPILFLLQNIRDEAHRFAIGFHRSKRDRAQTRSSLDQISGIGPQKKRTLLRHFGSIKAIREANLSDLLLVSGVSTELAHRIITFFNEKT